MQHRGPSEAAERDHRGHSPEEVPTDPLIFVEPLAHSGEIGNPAWIPGRLDPVVERYVDTHSNDNNRQVQDKRAADPSQRRSLVRAKVERRRQASEAQRTENQMNNQGSMIAVSICWKAPTNVRFIWADSDCGCHYSTGWRKRTDAVRVEAFPQPVSTATLTNTLTMSRGHMAQFYQTKYLEPCELGGAPPEVGTLHRVGPFD